MVNLRVAVEEDEYDRRDPLSVRVACNPGLGCCFPVCQTALEFNLDRDYIVQGTIDRDLDVEVHFAQPLRVQGLK